MAQGPQRERVEPGRSTPGWGHQAGPSPAKEARSLTAFLRAIHLDGVAPSLEQWPQEARCVLFTCSDGGSAAQKG